MKKTTVKMDKNMAKKILRDVSPETCFWINNGPVLKSLRQLPTAIRRMKQDTFMHHVNAKKNDFGAWIKNVVGDAALATRISKMKTKKPMVTELSKRIKMLKKISG